MKQVFQNYKSGELVLLDVPVPACRSGEVLVRTLYSAISPGTEMMKVSESKMSLLGKARARPDQVRKVLTSVSQQGLLATYEKVKTQLDSLTPLGYSLCGEVVELGAGVTDFKVGDLVACAGNASALHAEYNAVPVMLCAHVPAGVDPREAALTTISSIALQGLRQSGIVFGESVCVIGLGMIGQILVRLLRGAGAQVTGIDISADRCRLAEASGAIFTHNPSQGSLDQFVARIHELTGGRGVDHVLISAGGPSNEPVETAHQIARDRARVTVIGKTSLNLSWKDYYEKEMEVVFSRSYGPGRYDPTYEVDGIDYPIGYVRWTEQRNMACILDMLASKQLQLLPLVSSEHPFGEAPRVYEQINSGEISGLGFLFGFPSQAPIDRIVGRERPAAIAIPKPNLHRGALEKVRIGFIGAGNYATSMLLPHLKGRQDVDLVEVATMSSASAANAQRRFGFGRMSTDSAGLISTSDVDLVVVATRHSSHAALTIAALEAGKAVFVEKPLAITIADLDRIQETVARTGNDRLMVGFNRRFAPLLGSMRGAWSASASDEYLSYRINAGRGSTSSWYLDRDREGTRFIGEGGHFIDTASWWFGSDPIEVSAQKVGEDPDNIVVNLRYAKGMATITYLVNGHPRFAKERIEVFSDGRTALMNNFKAAEVWGSSTKTFRAGLRGADKGQAHEMAALVAAVKSGEPMPISAASLIATTRATILANELALSGGRPTPLTGA